MLLFAVISRLLTILKTDRTNLQFKYMDDSKEFDKILGDNADVLQRLKNKGDEHYCDKNVINESVFGNPQDDKGAPKHASLETKAIAICGILNDLNNKIRRRNPAMQCQKVWAHYNEYDGGANEMYERFEEPVRLFVAAKETSKKVTTLTYLHRGIERNEEYETNIEDNIYHIIALCKDGSAKKIITLEHDTSYISFGRKETIDGGVFEVEDNWGCNPCPCIFRVKYGLNIYAGCEHTGLFYRT